MRFPYPRRVLAAVAAALLVVALGPATGAQAASSLHTYPKAVPSWATTANDTGPTGGYFETEGELFLPLRDPQGALALARAASTPGNPQYRHFISPAEWIDRFAPSQADFDAVVGFLTSEGAVVNAVPASRQYVVFRERTYFLNTTFHTAMHTYRVGGWQLVGPAKAPSLPTTIADKVAGIVLDQGRLSVRPQEAPTNPPVDVVNSMPDCSYSYGQTYHTVPEAYGRTEFPTALCAYRPDQMRAGLGTVSAFVSGITGARQTVAVIGEYAPASLFNDVNRYANYTKSAPLLPSQYTGLVPDSMFNDEDICGGSAGWQEEDTMDLEAVHNIAPGAHLVYVAGFNCGAGTDYALSQILDTHAADIVSNSYGYTGESVGSDLIAGETNLYVQAAAEGIGLYFASGDYGDNSTIVDQAQPDWPASSPWVTAVGGTTLAVDSGNRKVFEGGWGNQIDAIEGGAYRSPLPGEYNAGSGGGVSSILPQPSYQRGVAPAGGRAVPDIATDANPVTSMLIGFTPLGGDGQLRVKLGAGTSLATPLMAAKMALAQQAAGTTVGFANPALYARYQADPDHFGDIRPLADQRYRAFAVTEDNTPKLLTIDDDGALKVSDGYDTVTGLGDPGLDVLTEVARIPGPQS